MSLTYTSTDVDSDLSLLKASGVDPGYAEKLLDDQLKLLDDQCMKALRVEHSTHSSDDCDEDVDLLPPMPTRVHPLKISDCLPCNLMKGNGNDEDALLLSVGKEVSTSQAEKDCSRDTFIINGSYFIGAELGLKTLLSHVSSIILTTFEGNSLSRFLSMNTVNSMSSLASKMALQIMLKAARTNTGGVCLTALQKLLFIDSEICIPLSSLASPTYLRCSIQSIDMKPSRRFCEQLQKKRDKAGTSVAILCSKGVCVEICTSTYYVIRQIDTGDTALASEHSAAQEDPYIASVNSQAKPKEEEKKLDVVKLTFVDRVYAPICYLANDIQNEYLCSETMHVLPSVKAEMETLSTANYAEYVNHFH